jgi:uncharacterized protein YihD (DUF1040 family)
MGRINVFQFSFKIKSDSDYDGPFGSITRRNIIYFLKKLDCWRKGAQT